MRCTMIAFVLLLSPAVGRTLRISCEALPPAIWPTGAQGGTSARRSGAALSFVSCIRLFGSSMIPPMLSRFESRSPTITERNPDDASASRVGMLPRSTPHGQPRT